MIEATNTQNKVSYEADIHTGFERKVLDIDTIPFPYIVGGEGPTVLLLHLPVNPAHVYRKTLPGLAQHFRVYNVDMRAAVAYWWKQQNGRSFSSDDIGERDRIYVEHLAFESGVNI